jgi:hypothetical protein
MHRRCRIVLPACRVVAPKAPEGTRSHAPTVPHCPPRSPGRWRQRRRRGRGAMHRRCRIVLPACRGGGAKGAGGDAEPCTDGAALSSPLAGEVAPKAPEGTRSHAPTVPHCPPRSPGRWRQRRRRGRGAMHRRREGLLTRRPCASSTEPSRQALSRSQSAALSSPLAGEVAPEAAEGTFSYAQSAGSEWPATIAL